MITKRLKAQLVILAIRLCILLASFVLVYYIYIPLLYWTSEISAKYYDFVFSETFGFIFLALIGLILFAPIIKFLSWVDDRKMYKNGWLGKQYAILEENEIYKGPPY